MNKALLAVLILGMLFGCSNIKVFSGSVHQVKENVIFVDCSDELNNTSDHWGVICPVQITKETVLVDANEEPITVKDLSSDDEMIEVEVTLISSTNLKKSKNIIADGIKIINEN